MFPFWPKERKRPDKYKNIIFRQTLHLIDVGCWLFFCSFVLSFFQFFVFFFLVCMLRSLATSIPRSMYYSISFNFYFIHHTSTQPMDISMYECMYSIIHLCTIEVFENAQALHFMVCIFLYILRLVLVLLLLSLSKRKRRRRKKYYEELMVKAIHKL